MRIRHTKLYRTDSAGVVTPDTAFVFRADSSKTILFETERDALSLRSPDDRVHRVREGPASSVDAAMTIRRCDTRHQHYTSRH
ncbi:hypothetical protein EVAR_21117_1 [Eumeta japonica]|uniref:Uncharacterized protein n=1 Tax=Eumeta variegata TaxID=151549 RepID=A0A4C1VTT3_EUMVA|nr:hypothetical protein EVAR_21117_1 [Eumeta japonica]